LNNVKFIKNKKKPVLESVKQKVQPQLSEKLLSEIYHSAVYHHKLLQIETKNLNCGNTSVKKLNEQNSIETTNAIIEKQYKILEYKEGVLSNGFVSKNPVWITVAKNHDDFVYDTTTVLIYCYGGEISKMNIENYKKLLDFEQEIGDNIVFYKWNNVIKGHCQKSSNMEAVNNFVSSITIK